MLHEESEYDLIFDNVIACWNFNKQEELKREQDETEEVIVKEECLLKNIDFKMKLGQKIAIIGTVGSGKTSMLLATLGEMPLVTGSILTKADTKIVYAEQEPLIVTGTIQSNILFGLPYEEEWYNEVCRACCLDAEFEEMPSGDMTKLGEMGHSLSGGQKSRISLARALYRRDSKVVLIDGSLGTLDANVSSQVLDRAIFGLCRDKLVLFVTHNLEHAAMMDQVIYLKGKGVSGRLMNQEDFKLSIDELRGHLVNEIISNPSQNYESKEKNKDE